MRCGRILLSTLVVVVLLLGTGSEKKKIRIADRWKDPDVGVQEFQKILIIGITDDRSARRSFEDLFVSHLRGRELQGVTSYSLIPDLSRIEDPAPIVRIIEEQGIDGAITVRLVSLKGRSETDWGAAWKQAVEGDFTLRELIDESLPLSGETSKKYGVEVALWETGSWERIWAARTAGHSTKQLRKNRGDFVQTVMTGLNWDNLLR